MSTGHDSKNDCGHEFIKLTGLFVKNLLVFMNLATVYSQNRYLQKNCEKFKIKIFSRSNYFIKILSDIQTMSDFENEIVSEESVSEESVCEESVNNEIVEFVRSKAPQELVQFVPLKGFDDYEISTTYPHQIKRKRDGYIVKEYVDKDYLRLHLNQGGKRKHCYKHRIVANQFLDNPHNYNEVDHRNHNKLDNRIENLRFVSSAMNSNNKATYNGVPARYADSIPDESLVVDYYETRIERHEFEHYYYYDGQFYYDNNMNYRILNINVSKSGSKSVRMRSKANKYVDVVVNRFLEQHDIHQ